MPALRRQRLFNNLGGAIGYDAVRQIVLARIERRPARLDLTAYPYLPGTDVRMTRAADYAALLQEQAA